jgi:prepilin-type N-terminal cleavage/methylation domain-containing protein
LLFGGLPPKSFFCWRLSRRRNERRGPIVEDMKRSQKKDDHKKKGGEKEMKCFKKACRGEKGFTLIELLVVIMILGVLAAVVTLAVTRFIGKGTLESANAELVTVQAAVEACLAEANSANFDDDVSAWTGAEATAPEVASENCNVYQQMRTHDLKAAYDIDEDGTVSDADPTIDGGWGNSIEFSGGVWVAAS